MLGGTLLISDGTKNSVGGLGIYFRNAVEC